MALLDTGCGEHPWLDDVVTKDVELDGVQIGYDDPATDPELHGDLTGPLDGVIDPLSGHGTFIAGLVHQAVPGRRHPGLAGGALGRPDRGVRPAWRRSRQIARADPARHRLGEAGGQPIDVLSLSIGYYHETPQDLLFDPTLFDILDDLSPHGTVVVCSAGNDATSRPSFPAAFGPWSDGNGPVEADPDCLPIVSVGALNPNLRPTPCSATSVPGCAPTPRVPR